MATRTYHYDAAGNVTSKKVSDSIGTVRAPSMEEAKTAALKQLGKYTEAKAVPAPSVQTDKAPTDKAPKAPKPAAAPKPRQRKQELVKLEADIMELLAARPAMTMPEITEALKAPDGKVYDSVKRLEKAGHIINQSNARPALWVVVTDDLKDSLNEKVKHDRAVAKAVVNLNTRGLTVVLDAKGMVRVDPLRLIAYIQKIQPAPEA